MVKGKGKSTLRNSVEKQSMIKEQLEKKIADTGPNLKYKRLNCDLPETLFKDLKRRAVDEETSIKEIIIKSVKEYLKK